MKRKVLILCQKRNWNKGKPQVIEEDKRVVVFPFKYKFQAIALRDTLNKDKLKNPLHLREGWLVIGKEMLK